MLLYGVFAVLLWRVLMSKHKKFTSNVGGQEIIVETGKLAGLAGGAVTIRQGDTMLLATATMSSNADLE